MSKLHVLSRTQVFDHSWERIFIERIATEQGKQFDYLISEPNDFVIVVPLLDKGRTLLVRQYKHGAQAELLGFPAGFMHTGEQPEACAARELAEETNYTADTFKLVATLSENPTRCRNSYYVVFAKGARPLPGATGNIDDLEGEVRPEIMPIAQLHKPRTLQQIKAGPMLSALLFLFQEEHI